MQNTSEEITFEAPPTASETQEFNSTQILHDYISYLQTLTAKDSEVDDDLEKLDSLIKNKTTKKIFWINNVKVIVNSLIVNELKM
jgi:hypothetical protein